MRFFEIIDRLLEYYPEADVAFLEKAYVFASRIYRGKARLKGEPYMAHPLAVAGIMVQMRLGVESIGAALLHDLLIDDVCSVEELEQNFGADVAHIVQGVAKLTRLDFSNRKEKQAEYMRKMVLALSHDMRILLVKLGERLHDMRTYENLCSASQRVLAHEALDIYAPLAERLGIEWMKVELEDLAFKCLEPEEHDRMVEGLAKTEKERRRYIEEVKGILNHHLKKSGLEAKVSGRSKHLYSIYSKMVRQKLDLESIYDLIAFRIIVDTVRECYEVLGMVHNLWEPVTGRFKDYIVKPKSNMYQSLHTTVLGPYGERMEVQIRTWEMDLIAKEGVAAHWLYKQRGDSRERLEEKESQRFSWLKELLDRNREWRDPKTLFEVVKDGFYTHEIYVFTPRGDVKVFPAGSTPVDFAYEVHSEVGHRCVGARVNGKIVPLRYQLQSGDTVEILTATNHQPSKDWLNFVKTSKAVQRIRHWVKAAERQRSVSMGRELCEKEFRKKGLNFNNYINTSELLDVARSFSLRSVDDLLASIGYRKISPVQVIGRLTPPAQPEPDEKEDMLALEKKKPRSQDEGIIVRGADNVMIRMARCCNPVPGEAIVGYITRGRGITVHRATCRNVGRGDEERKIDVKWDSGEGKVYPVEIHVTLAQEKGMLANLSGILGQLDVNVVDVKLDSSSKDSTLCRLKVEVKDTKHLQRVLSVLRAERGILKVHRSMD